MATCSWSSNLAETFAEQGLKNVQKEEFATGDYVLVLDQMNYLNLFQELITKLPGELKEKLSALHTKTIIESKKGVAWKVRRFAFVGQKP